MMDLITEIAIYLGIAALLGFLLGYLAWGWGSRSRLEGARADGAAAARTSVDGDAALRTQLAARTRERDHLEQRVEQLTTRLSARPATPAPRRGERNRSRDRDAGPETAESRNGRLRVVDTPDGAPAQAAGAIPGDEQIQGDQVPPVGAVVQIFSDEATADGPPVESARSDDTGTTFQDEMESFAAKFRNPSSAVAESDAGAAARQQAMSGGNTAPPVELALDELPPAESEDPPSVEVAEHSHETYDAAPIEADDLTQIKGVGPVLERSLNGAGIYYFRQIACLTSDVAEQLNDAISAHPGLVQSEHWVLQAQLLHDEKYDFSWDDETV